MSPWTSFSERSWRLHAPQSKLKILLKCITSFLIFLKGCLQKLLYYCILNSGLLLLMNLEPYQRGGPDSSDHFQRVPIIDVSVISTNIKRLSTIESAIRSLLKCLGEKKQKISEVSKFMEKVVEKNSFFDFKPMGKSRGEIHQSFISIKKTIYGGLIVTSS